MPHFIIDCSENIIQHKSPDEILQAVYDVAEASGLFAANDIKVRLRPHQYFKLGKTKWKINGSKARDQRRTNHPLLTR